MAGSLSEALSIANQTNPEEIFVRGGEQVYREALPLCDRIYLTLVSGTHLGDAHFPDYSEFRQVISHSHVAPLCTFLIPER